MPLLAPKQSNWTPLLLALSLLLNLYFVLTRFHDGSTAPDASGGIEGEVAAAQEGERRGPGAGQSATGGTTPAALVRGQGYRVFSSPLRGSIAASLEHSLPKEEGEMLAAHLARSLGWQLNLRSDPRPEDRFAIVYRYGAGVQRSAEEGPGDPLEILAYEYHSARLARSIHGYRFRPQGSRWPLLWDESGVEVAQRLVHSPVAEYEAITARLGDGRGHDGVDFKVPVGSPVVTPNDAKVLRKNWNVRANGYCVDLLYDDSRLHGIFLHLSDVQDEVVIPGKRVNAGTVIALSGNTGKTTNPHLHYGLRRGKNKYLDPFAEEPTTRLRIGTADSAAFAARKAEMDALLNPAE
jgi:murein DD-endopeptidase MepM/ murein hydrolase activator NlpD